MNSDFKDLLRCLSKERVKYLIIGGYAVSYYSEPRYTKDLDIWVEPTKSNSKKVIKALTTFGAPTDNLDEADFSKRGTLFIFGLPPNRVDILTSPKGATFKTAWKNKTVVNLNKLKLNFISIKDLIKLKKATGRPQDKLDLESLKAAL